MKKSFLFPAALVLTLLSATCAAANVNPAIVSSDAKWLIHADLNRLRDSAVGKELLTVVDSNAQMHVGDMNIGLNVQKLLATIGTVTAYGANLSPDPAQIDGTLVIQGTPELRKILESVLIQANLAHPENVTEITDLPFPAYALKDTPTPSRKPGEAAGEANEKDRSAPALKPARSHEPFEVFVAFPPEPIVVVSKAKAQLVKARDVARGAAPSLAKNPASPLNKFLAGADGAYVFAASTMPAEKFFPEDGPQARVLKMTNAGALALGERGENTFLHGDLVASSGAMAEKLMKILEGMTAMMSLAETSDKQLAEFLNSAAVNRDGDVVTLDLAYSSARLGTMIKNLRQQPLGPQERAAARTGQMLNGRSLAEWTAEAGPAYEDGKPAPLTVRTIENVTLRNGTLLTLARQSNGGRNVRYDHVDIVPAGGTGAALTFRPEFMRTAGPRGNWQQFQFPGADGTYTLKISYVSDPSGKATFAVSARDMARPDADALPAPAPQPKNP